MYNEPQLMKIQYYRTSISYRISWTAFALKH